MLNQFRRFRSLPTKPHSSQFIPSLSSLTGSSPAAPAAMDIQAHASLSGRSPRAIRKINLAKKFRVLSPQHFEAFFMSLLNRARGDPAKILNVYASYSKKEGGDDTDRRRKFLVSCLSALGGSFSPNSFWAVSDRQVVLSKKVFKELIADLIDFKGIYKESEVIRIIYALGCMHYRPERLLKRLLDERLKIADFKKYKFPVLSSLGWALSILNAKDGLAILKNILLEASKREQTNDRNVSGSASDLTTLAFAACMAGLWEIEIPVVGILLGRACEQLTDSDLLDDSGWSQFYIYSILYSADVENPASEIFIKQSVPLWIQERLHNNWLDGILLKGQPVGSDRLLADIANAMKRTNTQHLLHCSVGRDEDVQHCIFAGLLLKPKIAVEADSFLPENGKPRVGGWLNWKSRLMQRMGVKVAIIHKSAWDVLSEEQKEERIVALRTKIGYQHERAVEDRKTLQKIV